MGFLFQAMIITVALTGVVAVIDSIISVFIFRHAKGSFFMAGIATIAIFDWVKDWLSA